MLIRSDKNRYIFIKRKDFKSDKEYFNEIIKLKYKTSLNKNNGSQQKILSYIIS